ncbi:sulfite exporter TauE/SafE family protein [Salinisphaera sp. SPP-AMP-43]|uniref:sulfite exporter TauE/SafE family protein n=1 Tax=Salinisphaera sp. SPP-AMP-43 TaxID=3121288 RepID=UPI003C6DFFCD
MNKLLIFGLAGFIAQLVDGGLGMGYGLTSASILVALGVTPAIASASIHFAELATTAASGTAHYRFGNVEPALFKRMIWPGAIGAFVGACLLSLAPGDAIKPLVSGLLLLLGLYVLTRFIVPRAPRTAGARRPSAWLLVPLSLVAGFFDSIGGGGWGPIATPTLMARAGSDPRRVIGTVDASEFVVTLAGTLGFALVLGVTQINWGWVAIFALSGLVAAPLAAWLVRLLPARILGVFVGGMIVVTNTRTLLAALSVDVQAIYAATLVLFVAWAALVAMAIWRQLDHQNAARSSS